MISTFCVCADGFKVFQNLFTAIINLRMYRKYLFIIISLQKIFILRHNLFNMGSIMTTCPILLYDSLWYKTMPERTLGQSDKLKNKTFKLVLVLRSVDK